MSEIPLSSSASESSNYLVLHSSGVKLWKGKRYVLITLVSAQTIPNIVPIFQEGAPQFDQIYFLHTTAFKEQFSWTVNVLKLRPEFKDLKVDWYDQLIDNVNWQVTYNISRELIQKIRYEADRDGYTVEILCNWTLGTKPMSIGLVEAARETDCSTLYTENNVLVDPGGIYPSSKNLNVQLTVREYLQAYGIIIENSPNATSNIPRSDWIIAADYIQSAIQVSFRNSSSWVRLVYDDLATGHKYLDQRIVQPENLVENLRKCGVLSNFAVAPTGQLVLEPVSSSAWNFLKGVWLEYYVYNRLKQKFDPASLGGVDSRVAQGVKIIWRNRQKQPIDVETEKAKLEIDNELDVLLTKGTEINFISCKMGGSYRSTEGEIKADYQKNEPVYELETITRSAGLFLKKFLVICQQEEMINRHLLGRAEVFGITVRSLKHLEKIEDYI
jgi:hypothetical protein